MTPLEIFDACGISLDRGMCSLCDLEFGWSEEIERKLFAEFPEYFLSRSEMHPTYRGPLIKRPGIRERKDIKARKLALESEHHDRVVSICQDSDGTITYLMICFAHWGAIPPILVEASKQEATANA